MVEDYRSFVTAYRSHLQGLRSTGFALLPNHLADNSRKAKAKSAPRENLENFNRDVEILCEVLSQACFSLPVPVLKYP
jgi:hypothetical protein